jgi:ATP-binding cassette, subfamily B, bacterial MsbA
VSSEVPAGKIYRRLLQFVGPYRGVLVVALIGMLIEAAAAGAFAKLMNPMVD